MEIQSRISKNIRLAREGRKLTLEQAAKLTGVSRSMLAQVEKGDVNPTISLLWKIAEGYKVSFTSLAAGSEEALVVRRGETQPIAADEGRYINYPAFPFQEERPFETYAIEILPEGSLFAQPHMAGTEEYITVFEGRAEITAGEDRYVLDCGDSLRFHSDVPHSYRNAGGEIVKMSMLIYYAPGR